MASIHRSSNRPHLSAKCLAILSLCAVGTLFAQDQTVTGDLFVNGGDIAAGTTTNLSLAGGSSGAKLILGQGSTGNATFTLPSTGSFLSLLNDGTGGGSGTAQQYMRFGTTSTSIAKILRGNGESGYDGNGFSLDTYEGFQLQVNKLGGSGGTIRFLGGDVWIKGTTTGRNLHLDSNSATNRGIAIKSAGADRWYLFATNIAESGGSVGTDLALTRFADNGSAATVFLVSRATGNIAFSSTAASTSSSTGALTVAGGIGVGGAGYFGGTLNVSGGATIRPLSNPNRPLTIGTADPKNGGGITFRGESGSWAFGLHAKGSAGTDVGGFGFYGSNDGLSGYYIGQSFDSRAVWITPAGNVTVTGDLNVNGVLTAPNYAASGGNVTGGSSGLTLSAGGSGNQNVTLTPTGTGSAIVDGRTLTLKNDNGTSNGLLSQILVNREAYDPTGNAAAIQFYRGGNTSEGSIAFSTNPGPSTGQQPIERMRITEAGNVGIGTSSPSAKLVVASPQSVAGNYVVGEFSRSDGTNQGGSVILRLRRSTGTETSDFELNSGHSGPFRYGTYSDTVITNNQNSPGGPYGNIHFATSQAVRMTIGGGSLAGNVGIGTTSPTHTLSVNGTIKTKEVLVENTGWSDYVFAEDYRLAPLTEVEQHIREKKHLPGIPSAAEVAENGFGVSDMQAKLLAKIEELTLHLIAQEKRISEQAVQLAEQSRQIDALRTTGLQP